MRNVCKVFTTNILYHWGFFFQIIANFLPIHNLASFSHCGRSCQAQSPETYGVQIWAVVGPVKDIQRLIYTFHLIAVLKGGPWPYSRVICTLEQVFLKSFLYLPTTTYYYFSLNFDQSPYPHQLEALHNMMLPPPCFIVAIAAVPLWVFVSPVLLKPNAPNISSDLAINLN